jgi:formylglycine-generating enzyme required for sulfatase activity
VKASIVNVKGDAITYRADVTVTGPEEVAGMTLVTTGIMPEKTFTFQMGCNAGEDLFTTSTCSSYETPKHDVTLTDDFYIGTNEVTQAEWKAVMGQDEFDTHEIPDTHLGSNLPMVNVNYDDINKFINELNKQNPKTGKTWSLPTEAQWEYAARGGVASQGYRWSGNTSYRAVAWYGATSGGNSGGTPHPVGIEKLETQEKGDAANELGIYDMSGNVAELVKDYFSYYSDDAQTNPLVETTTDLYKNRVRRGGSYADSSARITVATRGQHIEVNRVLTAGFRLALVSTPNP